MTASPDSLDDLATRKRHQIDGDMLRALMEEREMTIRGLADVLRVEQRTISRWRAKKIDELTWLGILHKLGEPASWKPSPKKKPAH